MSASRRLGRRLSGQHRESLHVYPVKSCAGVAPDEALLIETGFEFDRAWMVVDAPARFVTQRELPRMALVQPTLKTDELVLRAPGMLALHLALDRVEAPMRVTVWNDEVAAYDMGDLVRAVVQRLPRPAAAAGALRPASTSACPTAAGPATLEAENGVPRRLSRCW